MNRSIVLRDIVTAADREAALTVRLGPGQDYYAADVAESFDDAVTDARAMPRYWTINDGDEVVGFVMLSDGVPAERLATDTDLVGPYFLWRLLIDHRRQRRGYGTATLDAIVAYLRDRPGADVLYTSVVPGDETPQPFYERYGFVPTGDIVDGEVVLRLELADRWAP
jgi:diamine N-acetyltransferase